MITIFGIMMLCEHIFYIKQNTVRNNSKILKCVMDIRRKEVAEMKE